MNDEMREALKEWWKHNGFQVEYSAREAAEIGFCTAYQLQQKRIDELVEALEASLELHEEPLQLDFRANNINAPEDDYVKTVCERFGYGATMDAAARLWHLKETPLCPKGSGHTTGHNYYVIKSMYDKAQQALAEIKESK